MTNIVVTDREGRQIAIDAADELPLMQSIKDNLPVENFGVCGGCCSCGTCQVYVSPADSARIDPASAEERGMLEILDNTRGNSRLSCQIIVRPEFDGLAVQIAPEC